MMFRDEDGIAEINHVRSERLGWVNGDDVLREQRCVYPVRVRNDASSRSIAVHAVLRCRHPVGVIV